MRTVKQALFSGVGGGGRKHFFFQMILGDGG